MKYFDFLRYVQGNFYEMHSMLGEGKKSEAGGARFDCAVVPGGRLTGFFNSCWPLTTREDLLVSIFSQFCLGK
jgi:tRNA U34 5-carboxymethylaminomethyl modifying GTPase MnmE/TrmE